jgi:altronate dehydratase large subunit
MNFNGYVRKNGTFGIRNHTLIFPTTGCAAVVAQRISQKVPGTVYISHTHGCGHLGMDKEHMVRAMSGYCANPNVAAVLLVGLGCEQLSPELIAGEIRARGRRFDIINIQEEGGTTPAIEKGAGLARKLLEESQKYKRRSININELIIGAKCGGSDTLSGLTANPALGAASDILTSLGGTVILSEVPEMLGAESVLVGRAANDNVRKRIIEITSAMEESILKMGVDVRGSEPSPGNIAGGLTTLEEKSLGAIRKGGKSTINEVVPFGSRPSQKGLVIMDGPALDAVSLTGMTAAGAQLILFTTGRGTPLGSAICPVIKIASNSLAFQRMGDDLDINAGEILDSGKSIQIMAEQIFNEMLAVAGGKLTRSEVLGHNEFAIHSMGPAV